MFLFKRFSFLKGEKANERKTEKGKEKKKKRGDSLFFTFFYLLSFPHFVEAVKNTKFSSSIVKIHLGGEKKCSRVFSMDVR